MSNEQKLRDAFEARMTDNGKWPRAVEQGRNGCYLLAQTENAWVEWQACAEALATTEPEPLSDEQIDNLIHTKHFDPKYKLHESDKVCLNWYRLGLRDGERAHGIVDAAIDAAMAKG